VEKLCDIMIMDSLCWTNPTANIHASLSDHRETTFKNYQEIGSTANLEFEQADFFKEQPAHRIQGADAYFLRHILHDWP
jgi:hypothetical protein